MITAQGEEDVFQDYVPAEFSKYDDFESKGEKDFDQNFQTLTKTSARVSLFCKNLFTQHPYKYVSVHDSTFSNIGSSSSSSPFFFLFFSNHTA